MGGSRQNFVVEQLESRMGNGFEAKRRLAQFRDALPQRRGMLGAIVGVQAEGRLEFVDRLCRDASREDFMQSDQRIVMPFDPMDAFFNTQFSTLSLFEGTKSSQWGQLARPGPVIHRGRFVLKEWFIPASRYALYPDKTDTPPYCPNILGQTEGFLRNADTASTNRPPERLAVGIQPEVRAAELALHPLTQVLRLIFNS